MSVGQYLSTAEAAEILGYSRFHVGRLIREGDLVARKASNRYWIHRDDLNRFMLQRVKGKTRGKKS